MITKSRMIVVSILLGALAFGGLFAPSTQAQQNSPPTGAPGARESLQSFFQAITAGDLVLLKDGGALNGTLQGDQFTLMPSTGEQAQNLSRSEIAMITFGDQSDQLVLTNGNLLTGIVQVDSLTLTSPTEAQLTLPKAKIATTIFKINPPAQGAQDQGEREAFRVFRNLRSQKIFALFSNHQIWSGTIVNSQFVFHSALFGVVTLPASNVASIRLASDASGTDFISLKTGDRISGQLDESSNIQFQPLGLTDDQGNPVTLTLQRGQISTISFRLPASAFGGGGNGPGFGGGPGK